MSLEKIDWEAVNRSLEDFSRGMAALHERLADASVSAANAMGAILREHDRRMAAWRRSPEAQKFHADMRRAMEALRRQ